VDSFPQHLTHCLVQLPQLNILWSLVEVLAVVYMAVAEAQVGF
jgi:hypothetical protein